eukprot:scaffold29_cov251-Pinguiococcus_pyrenoidosus.AAC.32
MPDCHRRPNGDRKQAERRHRAQAESGWRAQTKEAFIVEQRLLHRAQLAESRRLLGRRKPGIGPSPETANQGMHQGV